MQYAFSKEVYNAVWGKGPRSWEFPKIFVLKVTLQSPIF